MHILSGPETRGTSVMATTSILGSAGGAPSVIAVENLVKRYKKATSNAVNGISFGVAPGSFFALLGPNGAGKTTTISILTTTLALTSGRVTIAGHDLATQASAVRRQVGIIFQKPSIDLNLTAEENVRFHAVLYGLYPFRPGFRLMPRPYREQVMELAGLLGIADDLFKPVKTFSGGMKRKLEILRTLLHRPHVLFLDEPAAGLDATTRRALWEHLQRVRVESGTTIFLTTHYLEEAEQADRICILKKGNVVALGSPEEIEATLKDDYLLIDAAEPDRLRLREELARLGVAYTEAGHVKIRVERERIHALLKAIDTPLTLVRTHSPSIEDAYVAIMRQGEDDEV